MSSDLKVRHKRLIALDFDHTIFHTTDFVTAWRTHFKEQFGIAEEDFDRVRQAIKDCCVVIDIDLFVRRLDELNKEVLHDATIEFIRGRGRDFVFADADGFIERHRDSFDLLLVTHGDEELQSEKIAAARLPVSIPHVIEKKNKGDVLAPYVDQYEQVYFVDDKASNIDDVKQKHPEVETFFMRRPEDMPYGEQAPVCEGADRSVSGLGFTIE